MKDATVGDIIIILFKTLIPGSIQSAITCSKLTIETLEQGVKYV